MPASNEQIADEVSSSVDAIKAHLRVLYDRYGLAICPRGRSAPGSRGSLLDNGTLKPHDF